MPQETLVALDKLVEAMTWSNGSVVLGVIQLESRALLGLMSGTLPFLANAS